MLFFVLFYVVIFGVPAAAAAFVLFAGVGRAEIRGVHLFVLGTLAGLVVWGAVAVRRSDGGTSYAGFLRAVAVVAVVGVAAAAVRCAVQARARRADGPRPAAPESAVPRRLHAR